MTQEKEPALDPALGKKACGDVGAKSDEPSLDGLDDVRHVIRAGNYSVSGGDLKACTASSLPPDASEGERRDHVTDRWLEDRGHT